MAKTVQGNYQQYHDEYVPGQLFPGPANITWLGVAHVPQGGNPLRPGDGVLYDTGEDAWRLPTSTAERTRVTGIVHHRVAQLARTVSSPRSNSDTAAAYIDGEEFDVILRGVVGVRVSAAVEPGQFLSFDPTDNKWDPITVLTDGETAFRIPGSGQNALAGNTAANITTGVNSALDRLWDSVFALMRLPVRVLTPAAADAMAGVELVTLAR